MVQQSLKAPHGSVGLGDGHPNHIEILTAANRLDGAQSSLGEVVFLAGEEDGKKAANAC